jgi:hypothetical protein
VWLCSYLEDVLTRVPVDQAYVEKLNSAKHWLSEAPALTKSLKIAKVNFRLGLLHLLHAIGMEFRDLEGPVSGNPERVFLALAQFRYGEIISFDSWTNFPVKLNAPDFSSKVRGNSTHFTILVFRSGCRPYRPDIKQSAPCSTPFGHPVDVYMSKEIICHDHTPLEHDVNRGRGLEKGLGWRRCRSD